MLKEYNIITTNYKEYDSHYSAWRTSKRILPSAVRTTMANKKEYSEHYHKLQELQLERRQKERLQSHWLLSNPISN